MHDEICFLTKKSNLNEHKLLETFLAGTTHYRLVQDGFIITSSQFSPVIAIAYLASHTVKTPKNTLTPTATVKGAPSWWETGSLTQTNFESAFLWSEFSWDKSEGRT